MLTCFILTKQPGEVYDDTVPHFIPTFVILPVQTCVQEEHTFYLRLNRFTVYHGVKGVQLGKEDHESCWPNPAPAIGTIRHHDRDHKKKCVLLQGNDDRRKYNLRLIEKTQLLWKCLIRFQELWSHACKTKGDEEAMLRGFLTFAMIWEICRSSALAKTQIYALTPNVARHLPLFRDCDGFHHPAWLITTHFDRKWLLEWHGNHQTQTMRWLLWPDLQETKW